MEPALPSLCNLQTYFARFQVTMNSSTFLLHTLSVLMRFKESWLSLLLLRVELYVCNQKSFTSSIKFLTQEASFNYALNKDL
jgi:hypothetical protein